MKKNKKQEPPYVSDDFQIGPYGAFEWSEDSIKEFANQTEAPPSSEELQKAVSEYIKRERSKAKKNKK